MTRYTPDEPLTDRHESLTFDCGSEAQTEWLRRFALIAQRADTARVYVIRPHGERRVAGYYALAAGSVQAMAAPRRLAAGAGKHLIPVVLLTRLGVDLRDQGRGLGTELMYDAFLQAAAISQRACARALLIHAETPNAARFYARLDPAFEPSPDDPLHLVLLMKDLRKALQMAAARLATERRDNSPGSDG